MLSMKLKDIVSVTGMPGLHKVLGQNKTGLILESVADGKKFASNLRQRVSILADISMFTEEGEVKLAEVLNNIYELEKSGETIPNGKLDNNEVKELMAKVLPDYDRERVYPSDMKKLFAWYHMLNGKLDFAAQLKEDDSDESTEASEKTVEKKAAPKKTVSTAKKTATKTASGAKAKPSAPRKMGS